MSIMLSIDVTCEVVNVVCVLYVYPLCIDVCIIPVSRKGADLHTLS